MNATLPRCPQPFRLPKDSPFETAILALLPVYLTHTHFSD